jgi:hypothetical protein
MKHAFSTLVIAAILFSCGNSNQSKAIDTANEIQAAIKPGTIATSTAGYTLRAKLNGKEWVATSMMSPETAGRIIGYKGKEYIGLPYSKQGFKPGKKIILSEDDAADLSIDENGPGMYGGRKGEMEITSVGDTWIEGKFFFTASTSGSDKTIEVTDGFFRVKL